MAERNIDHEIDRQTNSLKVLLSGSLVTMLIGTGVLWLQPNPQSAAIQPGFWIALLVAALILLVSWLLARRGQLRLAHSIFTGALTAGTFTLVILEGSSLPTLPFILVIPVATASLLLNPAWGVGLAILALLTSSISGLSNMNDQVVSTPQSFSLVVQLMPAALGLGYSALCGWLSRHQLDQELARHLLAAEESEKHRQELEGLLLAEQGNRERFQQAITDTTSFLNRLLTGDSATHLDLLTMDPALTGLGRLLNRTADFLSEAQDRYQQAENELDAARSRYILQSWQHYLKAHRQHEYETAHPGLGQPYSELKTRLTQATEPSDAAVEDNANGNTNLTVVEPIQIGGEVIGTLGLCRAPGERPWSPEERSLIAAITERLALAAENLRLHEDAQRRAAQERLISQVSARARETLDVDTVLKTTLRELGAALDVAEVEVRLGPPPISNETGPVGSPENEECQDWR